MNPDTDDLQPLVLTRGAEIASYRLESRLGEGGMGTVYRAFDTKLNRPVAIKFLSTALADACARRRFQSNGEPSDAVSHDSGRRAQRDISDQGIGTSVFNSSNQLVTTLK